MAGALFGLGLAAATATLVALVRVRHPAVLGFPIMMIGWLVSDLPAVHLMAQILVAAILVGLGGLNSVVGVIGLVLFAVSFLGLHRVRRVAQQTRPSGEAALAAALGPIGRDHLPPAAVAPRRPFHFDSTGITIERDLAYGEHPKRHLLDIYRPTEQRAPCPVVIQIHGGAWVIGHKRQQAQPLLHRLARSGYVAVAINYRLGPKHRFPDQIIDVKRAIAWVRANIADHGGDPSTIILTGGSAGGHLASLAALTPDHEAWQPGFESADTSVAGCVPFYGPPDFTDRDSIRGRRASLAPFLQRMVMPPDQPELWEAVSPVARVHAGAPPFFVIQGANDVLVWREEAQAFVAALQAVSTQPVAYWEVAGGQHAFDTFNCVRSATAVDLVEGFVGWVAAR